MAAVTAEGVSFAYRPDQLVLKEVGLTVGRGEVLRLVGENGSGKSTLLRVLAGHLEPTSGRVTIHGREAMSRAAREARWFMEATPLLYAHLTLREQVTFYSTLHGSAPSRVLSVLPELGLENHEDTLCVHLSSGQRRKLWFALALLAHGRSVLLLDEPLNDVDADSVPVLVSMLDTFAAAGGSVVLSTHVHVEQVMALTGAREHRLSSVAVEMCAEERGLRG